MRRNDTPGRIVTNVCTDVITCANLYDYRLRGLGVAGGQILGFSIDLRCRPYNILALPCECVISATWEVVQGQYVPLAQTHVTPQVQATHKI